MREEKSSWLGVILLIVMILLNVLLVLIVFFNAAPNIANCVNLNPLERIALFIVGEMGICLVVPAFMKLEKSN